MSANVWFEEVDMALKEEILKTVKVKDPKQGVPVFLDDDSVIIRKPEEDFKVEKFPCVSIYNLFYRHDPLRFNSAPVVVDRNKDANIMTLEDPAVPYNLFYQLDFWSKYQSDMNMMTRTWLLKHFRQFNLEVTDDGGVKRSCNVSINENPKKLDLMDMNERKFHTIISYRIWVELDDETRYNVSMVGNRDIIVNENKK